MKSNYSFIFLLSIILIVGCGVTSEEKKSYELVFSQHHIKLNGKSTELLNNWQLHPKKGLKLLITFNSMGNSLDFFDLEAGQFLNSYYFKQEGPDGIGRPNRVYFQDEEHIYFKTPRFLQMVDLEGSVKQNIRIWKENTTESDLANDYNPINIPPYFSFYVDKASQNMYYARTAHIDRQIFETYTKNSKIIGVLNWETDKAKELPIYLPDFYLNEQEYFGYMYHPQLCLYKDKLIVNYAASSEIFVYNKDGTNLIKYNPKSQFTKNRLKGIPIADKENGDKVFRNFNIGPSFYPLYYDSFHKVFYRFHEVQDFNNLGIMIKRDIYLMLLNENFEILQEEKMPKTVNAPSTVAILPEGGLLVGVAGEQIKENHFTYNLIRLKKI